MIPEPSRCGLSLGVIEDGSRIGSRSGSPKQSPSPRRKRVPACRPISPLVAAAIADSCFPFQHARVKPAASHCSRKPQLRRGDPTALNQPLRAVLEDNSNIKGPGSEASGPAVTPITLDLPTTEPPLALGKLIEHSAKSRALLSQPFCYSASPTNRVY